MNHTNLSPFLLATMVRFQYLPNRYLEVPEIPKALFFLSRLVLIQWKQYGSYLLIELIIKELC